MKKIVLTLAALATLSAQVVAQATVDAMHDQTIISEGIQSGELCYRKMPVIGEYGIPEYVYVQAALAPMMALVVPAGRPIRHENINAAATTPAMIPIFGEEAPYNPNVAAMTMSLDVTELAQANGTTLEGRTKTIRSAKIALLSISKAMSELNPNGLFKLQLSFKGLPSQTGISGTALPATTRYPYSATSPVLKSIESELINPTGRCE